MKQRKPTLLITPVLWFITTGLWTVTFSLNLSRGITGPGLLMLQGATVLVSLGAALTNLYRYRRDRQHKNKETDL